MPNFKYVVKDQGGKTIKGRLDALDRRGIIDYLRKKNLIIVSIEEERPKGRLSVSGGKRIKLDDIVIFSRQLATMVSAGIPLVSAFDILGEQTEKPSLQEILLKVRDDIQSGKSLSGSLAGYPAVFSPLFINMVKAGESSGMLDEILVRLANYLEKINALIRKVKSALIYPAVITVMAIIITTVLLLKVVPIFEEIFLGMDTALPLPTLMLLRVSNFLRRYFFFGLGILILGTFFGFRYFKSDRGSVIFDTFILRLPIFGKLLKKVAISKFSRTLSTLIKSGVSILTSLEIVGKTSGNRVVEKAVEGIRKNVREGERIAEPLAHSQVFPPMVVRMISVGEETGELENMLNKISDFYDEQVDVAVNGLTSLIEPLIIAFLGIVIGAIVICMFLPIFRLTSILQI